MGHSNQITTTGKNLLGGTRYVYGYNIRGFKNILKPNTKYTYSSSGITDGKAAFILLAFNAEQNKGIELTAGYIKNASETFTTPENIGEFEELYLGGNYTEAGKNCINSHFQIEEGAKASSYEPYTGGKPSPSPDYPQEITNLTKAELAITGKNILDESLFQENKGNTNAPIFLAKGTYVISVQNDTKWWETASNKQTIFVHTFDTNEFVAAVEFTNLVQGKRSYGRLTINKDCNVKIYSYGGWAHKAVSKIQLEAGIEATAYEPHKSKSTLIDLQGNELCSLPNGVKDEVVIDDEGNVSLIKRTKQHSWNCQAIHPGTAKNYAVETVDGIGPNYSGLVADKAINATNGQIGTCYVNQRMIYVVVPESVATKEQANQLYGGMKVIYQLAEPQTIPLGKVELPALPEATSNVWNDGNIPANVYVQYLKDVNIAFADLESKLTQAVVATAANL